MKAAEPLPPAAGLVACPECDLLQREPAVPARGALCCARCRATLYRAIPYGFDLTLAAMLSAAALFAVANVYPVLSLSLQGRQTSTTLAGLGLALHDAGYSATGALVFLTLVAVPAVEIVATLYLLLPLKLGRAPAHAGVAARLLAQARPWSLIEVLVLSVLVSVGRLSEFARLDLGAGFWSVAVVMMLLALCDSVFDGRDVWSHPALSRRATA